MKLPTPLVVADSWFSDSKLMAHVAHRHHGTVLVQGKTTYTFTLADGHKVKGADLVQPANWPWRQSLPCAGLSLCPTAGDEPDVWRGHAPSRRQAQRGSLLRVLFGLRHPCDALVAGLVASASD